MHLSILLLLGTVTCATIYGNHRPSIGVEPSELSLSQPIKRLPKNLFDMSSLPAYQDSDKDKDGNLKRSLNSGSVKRQSLLMRDPKILQTVLPQLRSILVFSAYVRDSPVIAPQTEWTNSTMVIIAPSDDALDAKLGGKKPWEFPELLDSVPEDADQIAARNLERFLNAHIVSNLEHSIIKSGQGFSALLMNGKSVSVRFDGMGVELVQVAPGAQIPVVKTVQVENGIVLIVDDVLVSV